MCGAFSVATGLPSFSTASVCLPASLPLPSNTVILFLRIRCATPDESCFATARERFTTLSRSKFGSTAAKPNSGRWCSRWLISRRAQQRLGRDAAPVQADAAEVLALHHRGLHAELRRADGGDVAAGAAAEHDQVEALVSHCSLPWRARSARRRPSCRTCQSSHRSRAEACVERDRRLFQFSTRHSTRRQFSATARCARWRSSARPMPRPRCAGSTNRSSRKMSARPRKVLKV